MIEALGSPWFYVCFWLFLFWLFDIMTGFHTNKIANKLDDIKNILIRIEIKLNETK